VSDLHQGFCQWSVKIYVHACSRRRYLCIGTNTAINWDTWDYDLCIDGNRTLVRDINIKGSLFLNDGILNLNGYKLSVEEISYKAEVPCI